MTVLTNQFALVTGGTAGIGKAIATIFAQQGAQVAIFGTNEAKGQQAATDINALVGRDLVKFYQVDVSKTADVEKAIQGLLEVFGKIDILVNNAGITIDRLLMRMAEEDWDRVLDVNAKSCYNTCRAVIRSMLKNKRGRIINISSVVGLTGNPGQVNYAASKAAVIGLTKALALEVASKERDIYVNCIAPGYIDTQMTEVLTPQQREAVLAEVPLGRIGRPEHIAQAALFLATAEYITGQVLVVDGGMVI